MLYRGMKVKLLHYIYISTSVLLGLGMMLLPGCALFNRPPVADVVASPTTGKAPLVVRLDASRSMDPDGNVVNYKWSFGDGDSGTGARTEHTFVKAGTYWITLTVTDDQGKTASATQQITVTSGGSAPPPPPGGDSWESRAG